MKTGLIVFLIIIGLIILSILGFVGRIVMLPWFAANTAVDTAYDITEKTLDADNVIYNYEWFKQQVEDIQAAKNKRALAEQAVISFRDFAGDRANWTFEDKTEYSRLNSIHLGLSNYLEDMIATYNARSKMANRSIFKDGLIPEVMEFVAGTIN